MVGFSFNKIVHELSVLVAGAIGSRNSSVDHRINVAPSLDAISRDKITTAHHHPAESTGSSYSVLKIPSDMKRRGFSPGSKKAGRLSPKLFDTQPSLSSQLRLF